MYFMIIFPNYRNRNWYNLCLIILLLTGIGCGGEGKYPMTVQIISKDDAKYNTPKNAFAALHSALLKGDMEWAYQTFTKESAEELKRLHREAGIDPGRVFDLERGVQDTYIIDKMQYKDAVLLVIEYHNKDGAIMKMPTTLIKEDQNWKNTNKFASDDELAEYMDYVKPEER